MSKWADLYTTFDDLIHTVPLDVSKRPPIHLVHKHVFGHIPHVECKCKPHVRFSDDGSYLVVSHRDHERGSLTADRETLQ